MTRFDSGQVWRKGLTIVERFCETPFDGLASDTDALQLSGLVLSRTRDAFHDQDHCDNRNDPGREKRDRHADHAQAPRDCPGALRQRASQRGEQTTLLRNDLTLAVNL